MINQKLFSAATVAAFATLSALLAAAQQEPIVIKLSHVVSPYTAKGKAALRFKTG